MVEADRGRDCGKGMEGGIAEGVWRKGLRKEYGGRDCGRGIEGGIAEGVWREGLRNGYGGRDCGRDMEGGDGEMVREGTRERKEGRKRLKILFITFIFMLIIHENAHISLSFSLLVHIFIFCVNTLHFIITDFLL